MFEGIHLEKFTAVPRLTPSVVLIGFPACTLVQCFLLHVARNLLHERNLEVEPEGSRDSERVLR